MKTIYQKLIKLNGKAYFVAGGFLLLLSLLITGVCMKYYSWLQSTIRAESSSYLEEISKKTGTNVQRIAQDYFAMLGTMELLMQNIEIDSIDKVQNIIDNQRTNWDYRDLLLIDDTGSIFDKSGNKISLVEGDYLRRTIVNREKLISPSQVINGQECVLFTIPVDKIKFGTSNIRGLGVTYLVDDFDKLLFTTAFDGKAYSSIINKDGTIAVPSSAPSAVSFGYNVISYLQSVSPDQTEEIVRMQSDIKVGIGGQIECRFNGKNNYITYYPIDELDWCIMMVVPVEVANAKTQSLLRITLWFCGFFILLVTALICMLTINFFHHKKNLEKIAFVDPITGGNTLQKFALLTDELIKKSQSASYALIYTNLESFRLFNEQFGREAGDFVLKSIVKVAHKDLLSDKECECHIVDDHFCLLMEYNSEDELLQRFENWYFGVSKFVLELGLENPIPQFGVYIINDPYLPLISMIDRARFTLNKIDKVLNGHLYYAIYDEKVHQKILREKHLEDRMEGALNNNEFSVFLQPKVWLNTERIIGAEALIRWKSKEEGMIYPDEFIPLFERNGFIKQVDLWVFEQVCKTIRGWIDDGREPIQIAVNCSRIHFEKVDFFKEYCAIFNKYNIPSCYIEIELTESVIYEDTSRISDIINQIHEAGFTCSIDDFGSGYSSLNMIKDIAADTLKLDKIFFRSRNGSNARGEMVIESIISMAKSLQMITVAEGVEDRQQVEMLKEMKCDYVQGYVFAKPMPISELEVLLFEN